MKAEKREMLGLPPLPEDSIKVIRNMRAASPPASASDLIEQQQKRGRREHKVNFRTIGLRNSGRGMVNCMATFCRTNSDSKDQGTLSG